MSLTRGGAPLDEYAPEAALIVADLNRRNSCDVAVVAAVVRDVFVKQFGDACSDDVSDYLSIAEAIHGVRAPI